MFSLFKKKTQVEPVGTLLQTDMHAHLVPGVDDGAPDLEAAVELVKGLYQLGYRNLIATPHIYWDLYKNTPETLTPACAALNTALETELPGMKVKLAAEYMMDDHFEKLMANKTPLLTLNDNRVLVEFPFASLSMGWKEMLFSLQLAGYQPVIAHPERYNYAHRDKKLYHELKDAGCELQVNLLSLSGYYGPDVQQAAKYLLKNEMVSFAGTDCHHQRHLAGLQDSSIAREVALYGRFLNHSLF